MRRLLESSPPGSSFDLKGGLHAGLPYTTPHADRVASQLALALVPPAPKKGIISDLDDTLWSGIAGEIGPENVSWNIASHSHLHGLYQKLLASLSEHGTLVGIASKNDPKVVARAEAVLTFDFGCAHEPRVLELINKTNQFNLNGRRYTEADWRNLTSQPDTVVVSAGYEDRFGPLGTIAVIAGALHGKRLAIETWVMSCRAFARRIEQQTLKMLFESTGAEEVDFAFVPTAKNGPLQEFFAAFTGEQPMAEFRLRRAQFDESCPARYHTLRELRRAGTHG